jgi:hypothetical protein
MNFTRSAAAVIAGYLVFGAATGLLFAVVNQDPHSVASTGYMIGTTLYGALAAALGGFVTASIARSSRMGHAAVLAGIIAGGALVSILTRASDEAMWSQLAAIVVIAPSAILGGWIKAR